MAALFAATGAAVPIALVAAFVLALGAIILVAMQGTHEKLEPGDELDRPEFGDSGGSASPAVLSRALRSAARLAEHHGIVERIERELTAADIPLRAAELFVAHIAGILIFGVGVWLLSGSGLFAIVVMALTAMLPPAVLQMKVRRRQKRFVAQLPDMLAGLAGALRAGWSVPQALDAIANDAGGPMGRELRKVVAELRLGQSPADAMGAVAARIGNEDFDWVVLALRIQGEVGGNLAELLDRLGHTVRARAELRGDVKALTAEGRASAAMLVCLPPVLMMAMFALNRSYMLAMFKYTAGHIMLGVSAVMILVGYFWMRKVVNVDV